MSRDEHLTRSGHQDLAPATNARAWALVLDYQGTEVRPRLLELVSLAGQPFEVELSWSGGSATGARALVTVGTAARVGLLARGVSVRASNLSQVSNRVLAALSDGHVASSNVYEVVGEVPEDKELELSIPPYARCVWLDAGGDDSQSLFRIRLKDGQGVVRASIRGDMQPSGGCAVGASSAIAVTGPSGVPLRLVFTLAI